MSLLVNKTDYFCDSCHSPERTKAVTHITSKIKYYDAIMDVVTLYQKIIKR